MSRAEQRSRPNQTFLGGNHRVLCGGNERWPTVRLQRRKELRRSEGDATMTRDFSFSQCMGASSPMMTEVFPLCECRLAASGLLRVLCMWHGAWHGGTSDIIKS